MGAFKLPAATQSAVRGVYRCIVRHCRALAREHGSEPLKILRDTRSQFRRRRRYARIGHLRVAYSLEEDLREVCLGRQELREVAAKYRRPDAPTPTAKSSTPALENNAQGRYMLWRKHESRAFDEFNIPPKGSAKREVHRRAKLFNLRANYLRHLRCGRSREDSSDSVDMTIVDTILAPSWYAQKHPKKVYTEPRKVQVKSVSRSSGELSLLHVQGVRLPGRGFRKHITRVQPEFHSKLAAVNQQIAMAQLYVKEPELVDFGCWIAELRQYKKSLLDDRKQLLFTLEVHRRILIRRRDELEREWAWKFRHSHQASEKPIRLDSL